MHPAPSVIAFTTFSGLGFGLLVFLGLGTLAVTGWAAFAWFALAYAAAVGGLVSSTFHLGRPERALKAFTQWRTSWLSREGWCAVLALLVMAVYGAGLVFLGQKWTALGWLGAALSLATVFTTSMIYAQLRTVPRWNMPLTPAKFLALSLAGGALVSGQGLLAMGLLLVAGITVAITWSVGDTRFASSGTTLASATGLGGIGAVRAFEPPHTGTNYLLREFVFAVGRKHRQKLRWIALIALAGAPLAILAISTTWPATILAALFHIGGVLVARWLFFAEAEHVVGLYYGRQGAPA